MSNLAIIPARGGSKRIPHKNIRDFLGKPIISYSIETAVKSGLFDEVMVSTDDPEIASLASNYGAVVPFLRSEKSSDDYATLADVLMEVVRSYDLQGKNYDTICCLLPTAPLTSHARVQESYRLLMDHSFDSICPVSAFSYPIFRALEFNGNHQLQMIWPENLTVRSQDLKPAYHDSGSFYWIRTSALMKESTLFCKNGSGLILPESEVQDIDTLDDWSMAELKYKLIHG